MDYFYGFKRKKGYPGIRNILLIVATVSCVNHVVQRIAQNVGGVPITHDYGCMEFPSSLQQTTNTLVAAANHPNVGAVLIVGLGCEQIDARELCNSIEGKPAHYIIVTREGGSGYAIENGIRKAKSLKGKLLSAKRSLFHVSKLLIGVVCGASDWTTVISSNPTLGVMADLLTEKGGTVAMTETSGIPGTENILASRAVSEKVAGEILAISAHHVEQAYLRYGCSIYKVNPSPGNKAGGITTMVEKGLGNIKKVGHGPIYGVVKWGGVIKGPGVWIMRDSGIGPDIFSITGLSVGGCQIVVFTTGSGSPIGGALVPVIKVTGNPATVKSFAQNIDFDSSTVIQEQETLNEVGKRLYKLVIEVAGGKLTTAEDLGHKEFGIPRPE